ncbi:RNA polymerase subunit sigma-70 [Dactylosporangium sp. NPDC000244]|uniref:RNA polymerase subunit sigma-70 n=1 Tax=Dactylosporangium sp. NPDC000244 TaxID=3154365 RepID=UPI00331E6026
MEEESDVARARAGDDAAFTRLIAPLRGELHAHCYRILGSSPDADDALQDALLRAWRGLAGFQGRGSLRSWLYTVATRTSVDLANQRGRRALPVDLSAAADHVMADGDEPLTGIAWLGPYADTVLAAYEQREAVELAFVAALQHLPGNQRAALLLFDVLGFTVSEIAEMMDTSSTAVNSALSRARRVIADKAAGPTQQEVVRKLGDARVRQTVTEFANALERGDIDRFVALLTDDVTWSMPPLRHWYRGRSAVADFALAVPMTRCPSWRYRPISANGQPAVAFYVGPDADSDHLAWSITALTLRADRIATITSFLGAEHFPAFGLPSSL